MAVARLVKVMSGGGSCGILAVVGPFVVTVARVVAVVVAVAMAVARVVAVPVVVVVVVVVAVAVWWLRR